MVLENINGKSGTDLKNPFAAFHETIMICTITIRAELDFRPDGAMIHFTRAISFAYTIRTEYNIGKTNIKIDVNKGEQSFPTDAKHSLVSPQSDIQGKITNLHYF